MFESDADDVAQASSTGTLPPLADVDLLVQQAHARYAGVDDGVVADYIPILAKADPAWFGLALVGPNGGVAVAGDVDVAF